MEHVLPSRICIIGAGLTGLVCAEHIVRAGIPVVVLDKSRDIGGRLATRRQSGGGGGGHWNHGAPAVHAQHEAFRARLRELVGSGHARVLQDANADAEGLMAVVGQPDMRELLRPIARELTVELGAEAARLQRGAVGWSIRTSDGGAQGLFDIVVCTQPVPQTCRLLADSGIDFPPALARVSYVPAWVLLLTLADPAADLTALAGSEVFASATRTPHVEGETDAPAHWVLHAQAAWSAAHLELAQQDALALLLSALEQELAETGGSIATGALLSATAHRWRYARATQPLGKDCLWLPAARIAIGGDGCAGGDADGAHRSAIALANAVLAAARRDA